MSIRKQTRPMGRFSAPGLSALLLVLFLLSGRWSLSRVKSLDLGLAGDLGMAGEPRLYIVLALLFLVLSPTMSGREAVDRRLVYRLQFWLTAFYGYMTITVLWSPTGADRMKVAELALVFVTVLASLRLCRAVGPERLLGLLWEWFVPILAVVAVMGLFGAVSGGGRLAVAGGGPNVFGRNMGLLCIATLGLVLKRSGGTITLSGTVIAGALVVLSGSRGALVSTGVAVVVIMYLNREVKRVVYVIVIAVVLAVLVLQFTEIGTQAVKMFQHRVLKLAIEDRYSSGRTEVYLSAWELGVNNLWLGIGLNGFKVLGNHIYPHNIFLEVFCEGGLIGSGLLCLVLAPAARGVVVRRGGHGSREYAAFALFLIASQFSGDLYDARSVFVFAALLPLLANASTSRARTGPASRSDRAFPRRILQAQPHTGGSA